MIYVAGPFFNEAQVKLVVGIEEVLDTLSLEYFSPRKFKMQGDESDAAETFARNVQRMEECETMLAIIDWALPDKQDVRLCTAQPGGNTHFLTINIPDAGTMFEIGYCHARRKPVYLFTERPVGEKLNLMIVRASCGVIRGVSHLARVLQKKAMPEAWEGEIV